MEFIEAPAFTKHISEYLNEDEYRELQSELALNTDFGDLMPGTGGFRKLRWADPRRGKGRRGGLRIIYYFFSSEQQIWLMTLYDKDEATDLTAKQKKVLKDAVEAELKTREVKRIARRRTTGRRR
jgi:mRNA-degrading endonuclease RelE of RelBE toxin-antitoxin system